MTLPFPPRRTHLAAFWIGLHLAAGLAVGLAAPELGIRHGLVALPALFAASLAAGLIWRRGPVFLYSIWNKAAKVVAHIAQWWVLAVTYYVVLAITARSGSRLDLGAPSGSMWKPYGSGHAPGDRTGELRAGWARRFAREARGRDRAWWIGVLPFLLILSLFKHDSRDEDIPSNIYTLY